MASSDTLDCSNSLKPCNCTSSQICVQVGRSGTQCAYNTCVERQAASGSGGGKGNIGALAGEAVGGVLGGLALIIGVYWFWWRRRRSTTSSSPRSAKQHSAGKNGNSRANKPGQTASSANNKGSQEKGVAGNDLAGPPGPGEEDAKPVKRQSLRLGNTTSTLSNRRSLSGSGLLPPPGIGGAPGLGGDNPFGDHHSLHGTTGHSSSHSLSGDNTPRLPGDREDGSESGAGPAAPRQSIATSEFSFRSSHSTNIIPIAYIPAHASSHSIADLTTPSEAYGQQRASAHPSARHSVATSSLTGAGSGNGKHASVLPPRSSRLSVPFSLRSSATGTGLGDSLAGSTVFNGANPPDGGRSAFSTLFDRRASSGATSNGALEIIAGGASPTSPPLTTPTLTKDGKPIRPPRAPGLDLKLPTPEPISPPALASPGFPWSISSNATARAGAISPAALLQPPPPSSAGGRHDQHHRDTVLGNNARASAYSTFSQATGSSSAMSHMSYILDPPQIVTPVSAGRVEVQVLGRAAAKTVKLPSSGPSSNLASPGTASSSLLANPSHTPSPLARSASQSSTRSRTRSNSSSPMADNPFDDEAAVRIAMPSSTENTPKLPLTPTFGASSMNEVFVSSSQGQHQHHHYAGNSAESLHGAGDRSSMASRLSSRRDSDLSIFTSSTHTGAPSGASRVNGESAAGRVSTATLGMHPQQHGHPQYYSTNPAASPTESQRDEVILEPPRRPFTMSSDASGDSRHNSAALSTRSGYASVLDGIPFNLSLSPEGNRNSGASNAPAGLGLRASTASSAAPSRPGGPFRDSAATFASELSAAGDRLGDRRDTSYSLASEWNGAFAGMPIVMPGSAEDVPEVPSQYRNTRAGSSSAEQQQHQPHQQQDARSADPADDPRYSSDSLAMAAAVARSFDDRN